MFLMLGGRHDQVQIVLFDVVVGVVGVWVVDVVGPRAVLEHADADAIVIGVRLTAIRRVDERILDRVAVAERPQVRHRTALLGHHPSLHCKTSG